MFKIEFKQFDIEMLPIEADTVHQDGDFFVFKREGGDLAAMIAADSVLSIGVARGDEK